MSNSGLRVGVLLRRKDPLPLLSCDHEKGLQPLPLRQHQVELFHAAYDVPQPLLATVQVSGNFLDFGQLLSVLGEPLLAFTQEGGQSGDCKVNLGEGNNFIINY